MDGVTTSMVTDGMYVVAEHVEAGSTYYYRGMNLIGYTIVDIEGNTKKFGQKIVNMPLF